MGNYTHWKKCKCQQFDGPKQDETRGEKNRTLLGEFPALLAFYLRADSKSWLKLG